MSERRSSLPCGLCRLPVVFEFTVESTTWNRIVRAKGLDEYLCFWCFDDLATKDGEARIPVGVNLSGKTAHTAWCGLDVPGAYTEPHPEIVKLKAQLAELQGQLARIILDFEFALSQGGESVNTQDVIVMLKKSFPEVAGRGSEQTKIIR